MAYSIVVVTWQSERDLERLLHSIDEHARGELEVIVVDNASSDGSVHVAEAWTGRRQVIRLDRNRGFGAANNVGVRAARYQGVVLLNPDAILVDDSLGVLVERACAEGALYGPELLNADGSRQASASPFPASWKVALDALLPARVSPTLLRIRCEPWRAEKTVDVGWLTGACVAAPRKLLLELGPFDESIHLYSEDLDLGLRAWARGVRSVFAPEVARVVHLEGRSAQERWGDEPVGLKLAARRLVLRRHLGSTRERFDFYSQFAFHATRYVAKTALRLDARREQKWLHAALGGS